MEALHKHIKRFLPLHESSYTIVQASRVEGSKWTCTFKCGLASSKDIETFIDDYCEKNGETLRSASPKKCGPRSSMLINATLRCHHETRYGPTSDHIAVQKKKPGKRFKNTSCPYVMSIKLYKNWVDYPSEVRIDFLHNHDLDSLEVTSFKDLKREIMCKIIQFFEDGLSPGI